MNRKGEYADLDKWQKSKARQNKKYYDKTSFLYPKHPWTAEENSAILAHEVPDSRLSEMLHRSVKAIQVHRSILKSKMSKGGTKQ